MKNTLERKLLPLRNLTPKAMDADTKTPIQDGASSAFHALPCSRSSECRGPTHYAGCACHEKGWQNKWECAVEMAARAEVERDMWKANHDNQVALKRIIAARPDLKERAPMVEKLMAERNRAQAHSIRQHERIKRLETTLAKWLEWARMHGHLEHAAGIADETRIHLSSENA